MVCPFCPGPGTAYEKAFNRADVFKRHLTAVHNVEQTPPNSRKQTGVSASASASSREGGASSQGNANARCSICQGQFSNAQEFYEHLDDCVLNVIVPSVTPRSAISAPEHGRATNNSKININTAETGSLGNITPKSNASASAALDATTMMPTSTSSRERSSATDGLRRNSDIYHPQSLANQAMEQQHESVGSVRSPYAKTRPSFFATGGRAASYDTGVLPHTTKYGRYHPAVSGNDDMKKESLDGSGVQAGVTVMDPRRRPSYHEASRLDDLPPPPTQQQATEMYHRRGVVEVKLGTPFEQGVGGE